MAGTPRGPGPGQRRRSAETRSKVIGAAIACIAEHGLSKTTAGQIAERSGVSWGGIQHQFGDKASILDAVLSEVLSTFDARFSELDDCQHVDERVERFRDATFELLRDPTYRAFREIARNRDGPVSGPLEASTVMIAISRTMEGLTKKLFAEIQPSKQRRDLFVTVLFATLSGMVDQQALSNIPPTMTRMQLALLKKTLIDIIESPGL